MYAPINQQEQLNKYSTEPGLYYAEFPSTEQQRRYAFQGASAVLFTSLLLLVALAAS